MVEEFEKQCKRCLKTKYTSAFYRRSGRGAQYGDGLMGHCKECHKGMVYARLERVPAIRTVHTHISMSPRKFFLTLRMSPTERQDAEAIARECNCTISELARQVIRDKAIEMGLIDNNSNLFL